MSHAQKAVLACLRDLVQAGKIRALQNEVGGFEYYVTPRGAAKLTQCHVPTARACAAVDAAGNHFGVHRHRVVLEGKHGLLAKLGNNMDTLTRAMDSVHLVPLTKTAVNEAQGAMALVEREGCSAAAR